MVLEESLAVSQVGAQAREGVARPKAAAQQTVLMQLLEPLRVVDIGRAAGNVSGVPCIDEQHLEPALLQNLVDRDPLDPGRLHGDGADPDGLQPIRQHVQVRGEALKRADRYGVAIRGDGDAVKGSPHVQARGVLVNHWQPAPPPLRRSCVSHLAPLSCPQEEGGAEAILS
jgi:hypothetical protein